MEPDEPSLLGTSGKMVASILQHSNGYEVLQTSDRQSCAAWQLLLNLVVVKELNERIDTGGLLAGVKNRDAAFFLLDQKVFIYNGVTYFDTRPQYNCWVVIDKQRVQLVD